jgi:hypothetical protein
MTTKKETRSEKIEKLNTQLDDLYDSVLDNSMNLKEAEILANIGGKRIKARLIQLMHEKNNN